MPPTLSRHWRAISANRWQAAQRQQGKADTATKAITTRPTSGWREGAGSEACTLVRLGACLLGMRRLLVKLALQLLAPPLAQRQSLADLSGALNRPLDSPTAFPCMTDAGTD